MPNIFISYSRIDETFARELATRLTEAGADVWIDVEDIPAGMNWSTAIQQGLDSADVMLIVLSPDSMSSPNVSDEWQFAKDHGTPLIPLLWRPTRVHFQLHRLQYVDFHTQAFDIAFQQLTGELKRYGAKLKLVENDDLNIPDDQTPLETQEAPAVTLITEPTVALDKRLAVGHAEINKSIQRQTGNPKRSSPVNMGSLIAVGLLAGIALIVFVFVTNPNVLSPSVDFSATVTTHIVSEPRSIVYMTHIRNTDDLETEPITWIYADTTIAIVGQLEASNNERWFLAQVPHHPENYAWIQDQYIPEDVWEQVPIFEDITQADELFSIAEAPIDVVAYTKATPIESTALYNLPDWDYINYDTFADHFEVSQTGTIDVYLQWYDRQTDNGWFLVRSLRNGLLGWVPYNNLIDEEGYPTIHDTPALNFAIREADTAFYPFDVKDALSVMIDPDADQSPAFRDNCPDIAGEPYHGCTSSQDPSQDGK